MKSSTGALSNLVALTHALRGKRVAVIGDVMLDVYLRGSVSRISPEAPIPVVELSEKDEYKPGGAANVAANITALCGQALLVGIVGQDDAARKLFRVLKRLKVMPDGLIADADRPTTEKIRILASSQQVVRVDREDRSLIHGALEEKILKRALAAVAWAQAVVLEDYNKGVLTPRVIQRVIEKAHRLGKPVCVDPKFRNFFAYQRATVVKPNLKEARQALGVEAAEKTDPVVLARLLKRKLRANAVVLTLGEAGMVAVEGKKEIRIPARAREVYDVSGAGDTVAAVLGLAAAAGAPLHLAAQLANYAAGIEVTKQGTAVVYFSELLDRLQEER